MRSILSLHSDRIVWSFRIRCELLLAAVTVAIAAAAAAIVVTVVALNIFLIAKTRHKIPNSQFLFCAMVSVFFSVKLRNVE